MTSKGFTDTNINVETPNDIGTAEKPLEANPITHNRVDINVLKSKLQEKESKELKKIYLFCLLWLLLLEF